MGYETLPDRASDSGPDTQEPPKDWYDHLADAQELIQDAVRCYADDPKEHARKRIGLICEAMEAAGAAVRELQPALVPPPFLGQRNAQVAEPLRSLLNGISGGVRG